MTNLQISTNMAIFAKLTNTIIILDIDPLPTSPLMGLITLATNAIEFRAPDSGWASWCVIVGIACICLLISGFVSGSEIAYFGLTSKDIDKLREEQDDSKSNKAFTLIKNSEQLLATILISNNLVNVTMVILLSFAISQTVTFNSTLLAFLLQTVLLTFLLLLCGEILPKLIAKSKGLSWVLAAAPGIMIFYKVCAPLAKVMVGSSSFLNKVITKRHTYISTNELETALEISDVSEGKDKEMLEGILSIGDKQVCDIMIPRVDVTAIEYHNTWTQAVKTIVDSGFSRIPIYDTSQDTIRGVLYSKDLLPYIGKADDDFDWRNLIREAFFVPESRMLNDLLEDFRTRKIHIAIVIDEYGGTQGIVTLEDILEEILGEIDDEYDQYEDLFKKLNDNTYIFDAKIPVIDFCRVIEIEEEELNEPGQEAETLAGLLLEIKGDFPTINETVIWNRFRFQVLQIEKHRIRKVRVKILPDNTDNRKTS